MNEKYPLALPEGTVLAGQFVITGVLGEGGFGITYEATDHKTGLKVAVKEFFPDTMATRTGQTTVMPFTGERGDSFQYGKACFLQEAETLAEFIGNENIVGIHSYFEENGTAYFVMDYVEGKSFDQYITENGGRIDIEDAIRILVPIMDALEAVHSKGIVHRDVTPDNIYITDSGVIKLLDFGAARYSLGDRSRSLDVVLKHGFAPKEQYTRRGKQGPFTDVYTLGATFYYAITGRRPPDSVDRLEEDDLIPPSSLGIAISRETEEALLKALSVQAADRFRSMAEFKEALLGGREVRPFAGANIYTPETAQQGSTPAGTNAGIGAVPAAANNQNLPGAQVQPSANQNNNQSRFPIWLIPVMAIGAIAAIAAIVLIVYAVSSSDEDTATGKNSPDTTVQSGSKGGSGIDGKGGNGSDGFGLPVNPGDKNTPTADPATDIPASPTPVTDQSTPVPATSTPTPVPAIPTPKPATPTPKPATPTPKPATPTPKPATPTPKPTPTLTPTPVPAKPTPTIAPTPTPIDDDDDWWDDDWDDDDDDWDDDDDDDWWDDDDDDDDDDDWWDDDDDDDW